MNLIGHPLAAVGRYGWILVLALGATGCRLPYIPYVTLPPPAALAHLVDEKGQAVGNAVITRDNGGVRLLLDVIGLPAGEKAVHIHEVGRCDPPSFESAGAHFNPTKAEHGTANPRGPHVGDLPDITVGTDGKGHLEFTIKRVALDKKAAGSLLDADGSAIVIHESADDKRTDPAGNSGARIACGVIVSEGKR
ncbi:MAG TPA: superoxide dismutase family protein [Candidatus Acidoferrum sp.]|nr:superoxide dismutase family protein [Candidatus Acidoferrum sp.]